MSDDNSVQSFSSVSSTGLSLALEWTALLVATGTVCILPWLLGGIIPKARLVLQIGTISAAVLTVLARLVSGRSFALPPLGTWLLLGMAGIGVVQLQPWMPSAISQMNHSVYPEFREHLPGSNAESATAMQPSRSPAESRSVAPALTRSHVAQWVAVALLLCVVADSLTGAAQVKWVLGLMCANASVLTICALVQSFTSSRWLSEAWMITNKTPFGSFVNQNNAAGWLLVNVAFAIGFAVIVWGDSSANPDQSHASHRATGKERRLLALSNLRHRIASLNSVQVISIVTVVLLLTGVAATLSRGGIVAGITCLLVCAATRMQIRRSLMLLLPFSLLLLLVSVFLIALELDAPILAELLTLKDPVSEANSRVLHWSDSLGSFRDFPFLGSGQGAYAWSTRPYLRQGTSSWFKNADNQYVEILVESGLLGLLLCLGFGIWLTVLSLKLISARSDSRSDHGLRLHRIGIGTAGIALVSSQGIAAFTDYGIGLSSTMAAIALLGGILTVAARRQQPGTRVAPAWYSPNGTIAGLLLRIGMVIGAATAVAELRHEDQIDPAIVETARLFDTPVTRKTLERLPVLDQQLSAAMAEYPDHPVVRMSLLKIVEARFRLRVIDQLSPPDSIPTDQQLQDTWKPLNPIGLSDRMAIAKQNLGPVQFNQLHATIERILSEFPWHQMARDISRQMPLEPEVAVLAASGYSSIGTLDDEQLRELDAARFTDPAGDLNLFLCGTVCLLEGHTEQTKAFWSQSLDVSERFRVPILRNALRFMSLNQVLQTFAPQQYATTVRTAMARSTPELQAGLLKQAESQWLVVQNDPSREQRIQRTSHLLRVASPESTLDWIDSCLAVLPDLAELRPQRAKILEDQGKLDEAIGEWLRYQHFVPNDRQSAKAIQRLTKAMDK